MIIEETEWPEELRQGRGKSPLRLALEAMGPGAVIRLKNEKDAATSMRQKVLNALHGNPHRALYTTAVQDEWVYVQRAKTKEDQAQ
jgi:hypothetical protein